jgi:hypothetical protein
MIYPDDDVICDAMPPYGEGCSWSGKYHELVNGDCPMCGLDNNIMLACPFCGDADTVDDDMRCCSTCKEPF